MGRESIQQKRLRIRPDRVNLTYEVEDGGAPKVKELPFVVGVVADLGGKNDSAERAKFVNINRDNFNDVMERINPTLTISVENTLAKGDSKLSRNLSKQMGGSDEEGGSLLGVTVGFSNFKDFEPDEVVNKIKPLRDLVEARKSLSDLLAKMQGNDELKALLEKILKESESQKELRAALGDERDVLSDEKEKING